MINFDGAGKDAEAMRDDSTTLPLFDASTSEQARRVAAGKVGERYAQIVRVLADGPKCIFEVAAVIGCFDHQISGRFGELVRLGLIERTGQRRTKPATGCQAEVYRIAGDVTAGRSDRPPADSGQDE